MFYGYIDYREMQETAIIITKGCSTKDEAEKEFEKAYDNITKESKYIKTLYHGKNNGVMDITEDKEITIPKGYYGIKLQITN